MDVAGAVQAHELPRDVKEHVQDGGPRARRDEPLRQADAALHHEVRREGVSAAHVQIYTVMLGNGGSEVSTMRSCQLRRFPRLTVWCGAVQSHVHMAQQEIL